MKLSPLFIAALIAVAFLSAAAEAAPVVNVSGTDYSLGNVVIGQTGNVNTSSTSIPGGTAYDLVNGFLPADSKITFTYTIAPPAGGHTSLNAVGSYVYDFGPTQYTISSKNGTTYASESPIGHPGHSKSIAPPSTLPVLTSANLSVKGHTETGTATITNLSGSTISFSSYLLSATMFCSSIVDSYKVSAVPLSPSLVFFGFGLIALVGYSRYNKASDLN